ncbi:hypothetical protein Tco_0456128 [Tanacetum coccineum]
MFQSSCFIFLVLFGLSPIASFPNGALRAEPFDGTVHVSSFCTKLALCSVGGVDSSAGGLLRLLSTFGTWLLGVVGEIGSIGIDDWTGVGAGKRSVGGLKTLSEIKSGLLVVLLVSKWKWNMCVAPSSSCSDGGNRIDYGPSPFRFFHSWFTMEVFDSFMENTWKSFNIGEANGLIRLKKKLQFLKIAIKAWTKEVKMKSNEKKFNIQQNLLELDKLIDQGRSNEEILCKRIMLINDDPPRDLTPKCKRSQLAIRGVLVDGDLDINPSQGADRNVALTLLPPVLEGFFF